MLIYDYGRPETFKEKQERLRLAKLAWKDKKEKETFAKNKHKRKKK